MVSSVTPFDDMDPSPRVVIDVDDADLDFWTRSVTVWQISKWGQVAVRNAVQRSAAGGLVVTDYEVPPGVPVTYRVEQFDPAGASLGFVLSLVTQVNIPDGMVVLQDPLRPANAVMVVGKPDLGEELRRSRPTRVYVAGNRSIALSGMRSHLMDVNLHCQTHELTDVDRLDEVLEQTMVCVRLAPSAGLLPGVFFAVIPDVSARPVDVQYGGQMVRWGLTGQEVSRPSIDILVAVFSYDRFKAYLDSLHPPTPGTYDDAAAIWATYIDAMRNPPPEV